MFGSLALGVPSRFGHHVICVCPRSLTTLCPPSPEVHLACIPHLYTVRATAFCCACILKHCLDSTPTAAPIRQPQGAVASCMCPTPPSAKPRASIPPPSHTSHPAPSPYAKSPPVPARWTTLSPDKVHRNSPRLNLRVGVTIYTPFALPLHCQCAMSPPLSCLVSLVSEQLQVHVSILSCKMGLPAEGQRHVESSVSDAGINLIQKQHRWHTMT